jgi:hypothetical protein
MTSADAVAFAAAFNALRVVFPLRADKAEVEHLQRLYFRALSRFPIERVEIAVETLTASGTRFPKPAEWVRAVPLDGSRGLRPLDDSEAAEHRAALATFYQGDPCYCVLCQHAGVTHRMRRYVPMRDDDGSEVRGLLDGRPVTRGYWAHGVELREYYEARDAFASLSARSAGRTPRASSVVPRAEQLSRPA